MDSLDERIADIERFIVGRYNGIGGVDAYRRIVARVTGPCTGNCLDCDCEDAPEREKADE